MLFINSNLLNVYVSLFLQLYCQFKYLKVDHLEKSNCTKNKKNWYRNISSVLLIHKIRMRGRNKKERKKQLWWFSIKFCGFSQIINRECWVNNQLADDRIINSEISLRYQKFHLIYTLWLFLTLILVPGRYSRLPIYK